MFKKVLLWSLLALNGTSAYVLASNDKVSQVKNETPVSNETLIQGARVLLQTCILDEILKDFHIKHEIPKTIDQYIKDNELSLNENGHKKIQNIFRGSK